MEIIINIVWDIVFAIRSTYRYRVQYLSNKGIWTDVFSERTYSRKYALTVAYPNAQEWWRNRDVRVICGRKVIDARPAAWVKA